MHCRGCTRCSVVHVVLSYLVLSCLVWSCLVWTGLVWSCLVLCGVVLSCLALSCLALSCLPLSCISDAVDASEVGISAAVRDVVCCVLSVLSCLPLSIQRNRTVPQRRLAGKCHAIFRLVTGIDRVGERLTCWHSDEALHQRGQFRWH